MSIPEKPSLTTAAGSVSEAAATGQRVGRNDHPPAPAHHPPIPAHVQKRRSSRHVDLLATLRDIPRLVDLAENPERSRR
jgi:hypothetical protein